MSGLREGAPAPEFELNDQEGHPRRLAGFGGRWLVLFFYSRAMTPG